MGFLCKNCPRPSTPRSPLHHQRTSDLSSKDCCHAGSHHAVTVRGSLKHSRHGALQLELLAVARVARGVDAMRCPLAGGVTLRGGGRVKRFGGVGWVQVLVGDLQTRGGAGQLLRAGEIKRV